MTLRTQTDPRRLPIVGILVTAAAAVCLALFAAGCGSGKVEQARRGAPLVMVEPVATGEIVRSLDMTAEAVPVEAVQISSTVDGPVKFSPWREGDTVEKGQILVEIDRDLYHAEVKSAEAAQAVAQAKLDDLNAGFRPEEIDKARQAVREAEQSASFERSDLERIGQLVETGALPGEDIEMARVKMTAAEARLVAAQRQLEIMQSGQTRTAIAVQQAVVKESAAKLDLARARAQECVVTAPFDGTLTGVFVKAGDMVSAKAPLVEMADLNSMVIRCAVPESSTALVKKGMRAQVHLDAIPGKTMETEVVRVYPQLNPQMRTRTIELAVQGEEGVAPGMFGRVRLILEAFPDAVTIPTHAVVITPAGTQAAFVEADGKAVQRKVETGIEEDGRLHILSGLLPGESVIVSGQERLRDGAEIRLPAPKGEGKPGEGGAKTTPDKPSGAGQ